jgi:hypothetical protein
MTRDEFDVVIARVLELWPGPMFKRKWNHANQTIAFKKLSTFAQHEVLDCLENHRYDNPDAREPKFSELTAKLWNVKKTRAAHDGKDQASSLPSWPTIAAWADRKSDDDLDHLWQLVTRQYQSSADTHDKLWAFLNSLPRRNAACLTVMWAIEHEAPLTFKRGTDEWFVVMDEYDRQERMKEVEEHRRREKAEPKAELETAAAASGSQDEIPF